MPYPIGLTAYGWAECLRIPFALRLISVWNGRNVQASHSPCVSPPLGRAECYRLYPTAFGTKRIYSASRLLAANNRLNVVNKDKRP